MDCPDCEAELARVVGTRGLRYPCPTCGGVAMGLDVLDRSLSEQIDYGDLYDDGALAACPGCGERLIAVPAPGEATVRVCTECELAWVDGPAQARLPWASAVSGGDRCRRCGAPWVPAPDGSCRCCRARRVPALRVASSRHGGQPASTTAARSIGVPRSS